LLLSLINRAFLWDFYIVFSVGIALFVGWQAVLAVSVMALTMFAFQGLLIWPPSGDTLLPIAGQVLTLFSITGFTMLFQRLMGERFERNRLMEQLAQRNSELEEAQRQLAQSAAQEQELAVLRERTRLAREMHDTIGHALVLISVKLEAAQRLRERDPERCDRELESTRQIARETMTALRASIANLRSPVLEHEQISHALSRSARELAQRTGLHVTYTLQADIDLLPEAIQETLWKVSQEAFTNIEKHAHASHVQVHISRQNEKLLLYIHDDGIGLPPALYHPQKEGSVVYNGSNGHYGLHGMLERVEATGGHLTLHSGKEQGTTIEIELPLTSNESMQEAQKTLEQ
ncbi:MAG TPA: sensor histidine kinase, partial [Ktedonobacteraceae bacterium]|nr:sensor histidine kinase [Ktedonobacteraceae bacterium]